MKSQIQEVAYLLQRRGFIFEQKSEYDFMLHHQDGLFINRDSYRYDCEYLAEILAASHAGQTNGPYFRISENADLAYLKAMFQATDEKTGVGACWQKRSWTTIQNDFYGYEFPVKWLDPNIAYYVRVLGFCGLKTSGCCDGNHFAKHRQKMYVSFESPAYPAFHQWMWENLPVPCEIPWVWGEHDASVRIRPEMRPEVYDKLFLAAQYFEKIGDQLITLRQNAARRISAEDADSMNESELSAMFINEVNSIFLRKNFTAF